MFCIIFAILLKVTLQTSSVPVPLATILGVVNSSFQTEYEKGDTQHTAPAANATECTHAASTTHSSGLGFRTVTVAVAGE